MSMQVLLDFVRQKPLPPDAQNACPGCGLAEISTNGSYATLVGGANHHWTESNCQKCGLTYCYEYFDASGHRGTPRNVWFTRVQDKQNHVLLGMPSCYEDYVYDCAGCGGPVVRENVSLDGKPTNVLVVSNEGGQWTRQYRTFYRCTACKKAVETPADYWRPS